MKKIFLLLLLLLGGCATSSTHLGTHWGHSQGMVSSSDADLATKFVNAFHDELKNKKWSEVYSTLDKRVQKQISQADLEQAFKRIDSVYGDELSFGFAKNPIAETLHNMQPVGFDEAKSADAFMYYDAVLSRHLSKREKTNLVYTIGVTRPEKNADLRISSIQISLEKDSGEPVIKKAVLQISVAYPKVIN
jgi:hypothetical protein